MDSEKELFIEFISKKLASGKRIHELLVLKYILENCTNLMEKLENTLTIEYNIGFNDLTKTNLVNVLTNKFPTGSNKDTYNKCIFIESFNNHYKCSTNFENRFKRCKF